MPESTTMSSVEERLTRMETELRLVRDKQEIHDVLMLYVRGQDRHDRELIFSLQPPDFPRTGGPAINEDQVIDNENNFGERTKLSMHFVGNVLIEVDGDKAKSETYFISYHLIDRDGQEYIRPMAARWMNRWERIDGRWLMTYRKVIGGWNMIQPITEKAPGSEGWISHVPFEVQRSKDDPVYSL